MSEQNIFEALDPEVVERVASRREALGSLGKLGAGMALASVPLAFAALAKNAFAQGGLPQQVVDILNFALTLEYLEAEFYTTATAPGSAIAFPAGTRQVFTIIRDHEQAHVDFLRTALGPAAVAKPNFDFTAGGMFPGAFSDYATFITLAQAFEDTGVRAYKGQAPELIDFDDILTAALTIHSVEARHASKVRRMAGSPATQGWIPLSQPDAPAAIAPVYQGEDQTMQLTINVPDIVGNGVTVEDVTEAFDEPLTMQQVLAIVTPFIAS